MSFSKEAIARDYLDSIESTVKVLQNLADDELETYRDKFSEVSDLLWEIRFSAF